MSDVANSDILNLATAKVSAELENSEGVMALKAILLVQYVDIKGNTVDAFFTAGDPRFTELLGMLESHKIRVTEWFREAMAELQEDGE